MKERKLNFLLALLAALALVFAFAGCAEDGADGADGVNGEDGKDGDITDYSGATYNLTLDLDDEDGTSSAIWLTSAGNHTPLTSAGTQYFLGMVTLKFSDNGTGVSFIVDYASCEAVSGGHISESGSTSTWSAYASTTGGDIHYQEEIGDAYYHETANGVMVVLPANDNNTSALTLYFTASDDKSELTLTGTDASSTASYSVAGGDPSTADALGNTISNGTASSSNADTTAKNIFSGGSGGAFAGSTTVLADDGSSVFTKVQ